MPLTNIVRRDENSFHVVIGQEKNKLSAFGQKPI